MQPRRGQAQGHFLSVFACAATIVALIAATLFGAPAGLIPIDENAYRHMIAGQKGKIVLVNFWATWCAPCRKELPGLIKLESRLRSQGFVMVTVAADDREQEEEALTLLRRFRAPAPAYIRRSSDDNRFIRAVDSAWSGVLPALFLYERNGRKARSWVGETSLSEIESAIRKFL
jgi:thiol-disulfide isomerase/thioredoxin